MKRMFLNCSRVIRYGVLAGATLMFGSLSYAVFAPDEQPIAHVGALTFSTYELSTGAAVAFRGDYIRSTWDGDLVAYDVNAAGAATEKWHAKDRIAAHGSRKIATFDGTSGKPFRWSSLTVAQQGLLGEEPILNYLRGDTTSELSASNPTGTMRTRYTKLGAIIHGRPYYRKQGNNPRVYVGANDGMLHAFDGTTGDELFAYVPSMLFDKLKALSEPTIETYKYYVDGQIAMRDVPKGGGGTMTLLVSGLGGGAKGLFALDVSNASPAGEAEVAAMVKWEITNNTAGYSELGHIYAAPQIVKLQNGTMAVLVPNGVDSASGASSLFVINANTGALLGTVSAGAAPGNGLGGIAPIDTDADGAVDTVYAGDLKGTLWKFDFSGGSLPVSGTAIFTPSAGTKRPITATPSVTKHPLGGTLVNFGTGQVYDSTDLASVTTEYVYGIWDSSRALTRLAQPMLAEVSYVSGGVTTKYRVASASDVNYLNGDKGWRVSLAAGERVLGGDTLATSGRYMVTTSVPNAGATQGAWMLQLNAMTGGQPSAPVFDLDGNQSISTTDDSDKVVVTGVYVPPVGKFLGTGVWSQPVVATLGSAIDLPYFNSNANTLLTATTTTTEGSSASPPGDPGVSAGHFDLDIYYNVCNPLDASKTYKATCKTSAKAVRTHTHEYDDKYDVVGVSLLHASDIAFNVWQAIPSVNTEFRIMVANTNYSPAARLHIATWGAGAVNIDKAVWNLPLSPEGFIAATPGGPALTFSRYYLDIFTFKLPVNAFSNKEWKAGSGDTRSGLIPTRTFCVQENRGAQGAGATGAWMNGALTIQLVKGTTTGTSIQAAIPAGAGGYRLKTDVTSQAKQLAQYTTFWHHPNTLCLADAGWTKTPPPDPISDAASAPKSLLSEDPVGAFYVDESGNLSGGSLATTRTYTSYEGVEVTVSRIWTAAGIVQEIKNLGGTVLNTSTSSTGTTLIGPKQAGQAAKTGRLGWKELIR